MLAASGASAQDPAHAMDGMMSLGSSHAARERMKVPSVPAEATPASPPTAEPKPPPKPKRSTPSPKRHRPAHHIVRPGSE